MRDSRTFEISVGHLSESLLNQLSDAIFKYTVPLIVDDLVIGTGTLAQIDKTVGIFTARHVTTKVFERRKGKYVHGFLLTAPDEQPVILRVEIPYLDCWRPDGRDDKFGPDLAFLVLPEGHHFTSELRRKKSFVPISTDPGKRRKLAKRKMLAAVAGFVFGETKITGPESGFERVERPQGYSFIGGTLARRGQYRGFDFIDVDGDRRGCKSIPWNFRGVSGGGLWTFQVARRRGDPPGTEVLQRLVFSGVAFYELNPSPQNPRLRCHGAKSVYEIALVRIRMWLARRKNRRLLLPVRPDSDSPSFGGSDE
jgi:hypothetical protein